MDRCLRFAVTLSLTLLGSAALSSSASGAIDSVSTSVSVSPTPVSLTSFTGVSAKLSMHASHSGGFTPLLKGTDFHFDDDIAFDTTGLPQCDPTAIQGMFTAGAKATCPGSVVGSGTFLLNAGAFHGVLTAFNGTPSGGHARILGLLDVGPGLASGTVVGTLGPSSRGGDFGTQLDFGAWPNIGGLTFTDVDLTLDNLEPTPGHHFVSARCGDLDRTLNYALDATFYDSSSRAATAAQQCPPTGLRQKALKKCKKKKSPEKRRKCRKRAKRLPI